MKLLTRIFLLTLMAFAISFCTGWNPIPVAAVLCITSYIPRPAGVALMSLDLSSVNSRLIYDNAKKNLALNGVDLTTAKLTQSFLRLEAQLATNKTQYPFPVLVNQPGNTGIIFNTEQRLNLQDSFVAAMWGVFLAKPSSAIDATFQLYTYPSPTVFSTSGVATAAYTIYNSMFNISVNNDIILPAWDADRHLYVPETQLTGWATTGQTGGTVSPLDEKYGDTDGYYPVEPNLVFIGSKNSVITLVMPAALAAVETFQRLVVKYRGVLAQNSTSIT